MWLLQLWARPTRPLHVIIARKRACLEDCSACPVNVEILLSVFYAPLASQLVSTDISRGYCNFRAYRSWIPPIRLNLCQLVFFQMNGTNQPSSCARVPLVCTNLASRLNIPGLTGVPETESISSSSRSSSPMCCIDPECTSPGAPLPRIVFTPDFCRGSANFFEPFCGKGWEDI